jgi:IS4 transposase
VGVERIASIIGDREFIGEKWMSRLQELGIPFRFRFPKNFKLKTPKGATKTASEPLQKKKMVALCNCEVNGRRVKVFLKRLGGGEYLLLMGNFQPENLDKVYKKRWSIEVLFQNFKNRGFN